MALMLGFRIRIRISNGLEKGTCAANNHEQALEQCRETEDVRGGLGNKQGALNTIKTEFKDYSRGSSEGNKVSRVVVAARYQRLSSRGRLRDHLMTTRRLFQHNTHGIAHG